jgi:hypothetical protein
VGRARLMVSVRNLFSNINGVRSLGSLQHTTSTCLEQFEEPCDRTFRGTVWGYRLVVVECRVAYTVPVSVRTVYLSGSSVVH